MRKDDMANALGWVSKRASLDSAVQEGLPADRKLVAGVLREDPTLPDNLRIAYSRHLITLALALDDSAETDVIPLITAAICSGVRITGWECPCFGFIVRSISSRTNAVGVSKIVTVVNSVEAHPKMDGPDSARSVHERSRLVIWDGPS